MQYQLTKEVNLYIITSRVVDLKLAKSLFESVEKSIVSGEPKPRKVNAIL